MSNAVTEVPAAPSGEAEAHFAKRLAFETDCSDVHGALSRSPTDFVVLDVRGPRLYEAGHIPGAISLPHGKMTENRMSEWGPGITFVVYCAGPHCNGANKAALRLARLGRPVKEMIGGVTGWADEGFAFVVGKEPGSVADAEAAA